MKTRYNNIYISHLGNICSNYSILGLVLMGLVLLGSALSFMFYFITFALGVMLVVFTVGLIFAINKDLVHWLFIDSSSIMTKVIIICHKAFPYVLAVTLAMSVASLIILCCQKHTKSTARKVVAIVGIVLSVVFGIIYLSMGLGK